MAHVAWNSILRHLRRLGAAEGGADIGNAALLGRFVVNRDESAFAALVERYGPMVWSVCRRLLPQLSDAEDAFQATFLMLVRRAGSIRQPELLGAWLHGVAHRVSVKLRSTIARQRAREHPFTDAEAAVSTSELQRSELQLSLDAEVNQLPERYGLPFVLCYLEGLTNEEAARRLSCPKGTVLSRLSRARERLRIRLSRRGFGLSSTALTAALTDTSDAALVPAVLTDSTCRLGHAFATGAAESLNATSTITLTEGVLTSMFLTKLKLVVAVVLTLGLIGAGGSFLAPRGEARVEAPAPPKANPQKLEEKLAVSQAKDQPPRQARKDLEIRDQLTRVVKSPGFDDPKTTLQDALDQLSDKYSIQFNVNEKAFKHEMVDDVLRREIITGSPIAPMTCSLETVLQKVLSRISVESGATYLIRNDHVEITTGQFLLAEIGPDLVPDYKTPMGVLAAQTKPLLVYEEFDNEPLPEALRELSRTSNVNIVLDAKAHGKTVSVTASLRNVHIDTAVRVLAAMADLDVVRLNNVFFVTTPTKASQLRLRKEWKPAALTPAAEQPQKKQ